MAEKEWKFTFEQVGGEAKETIRSEAKDIIGSGSKEQSNNKQDKDKGNNLFSRAIDNTTDQIIGEMGLNTLNTMTGGFARPVYRATKRLMTGASVASVAGGLISAVSVLVLTKAIDSIQKRLENLQSQVTELGNNDNALIRAGSISEATYYSANLFGIKKRTNRS